MAPDVTPIERLEEQPIAVDPPLIEAEFSRVWKETASAGYDDSSIRVRVLNLVAVVRDASGVTRFEEAMKILPQRHPCRGLMAYAGEPNDRLGASIAAHCWRSGGGRRHVCSEEVLLTGAPGHDAEVASAVLGLLVPDLPVALWLVGSPDLQHGVAARVIDSADHVLLDSARADGARTGLATALGVRGAHGVPCSDLAWGRCAGWRALVAQLFDGAAGARELDLITSLKVAGGTGAVSNEALLMAGWLLTRLGLEVADAGETPGGLQAVLYAGTRPVQLEVAPAEDGHALAEVTILTADSSFVIARDRASGHLHVREDWDAGATRRVVEQLPQSDASVIALALDSAADVPVYEAAAAAALQLLRS